MRFPWRAALVVAALLCGAPAFAAPFTPRSDAEVVEKLPLATDPSARRVDSLRKQLAANPSDSALRIEIARRYFDLAMAQGDPRLVGYASAALGPIAGTAQNNAAYWLALGLVQQYSHDFEHALASLGKSAQLDPSSPEPPAWRAAIFMVQAKYLEAQAECDKLPAISGPVFSAGCTAYVRASSGQLQSAFDALGAIVKTGGEPGLLLWEYTRLAEMAARLGRKDVAESYFKNALQFGITDQFLLGAYADFLIAQNRPAEAIKLLEGWERSDVLLLRLALAGKTTGDRRAGDWAAQLRDRFQAGTLRGDRLHEQEAARFELDLEGNTAKALQLATANYVSQREPRDAEILMRTALAANQPKAAQPAMDWLRNSRYEDTALAKLADELAAQGATR